VIARAEIVAIDAPVADNLLDQLADVLVDCVEGGASVSFMSPFSHDQALVFFRTTRFFPDGRLCDTAIMWKPLAR
jgi:hypothetical protein